MRRMVKTSDQRSIVAAVSVVLMSSIAIGACAVDYDGISRGLDEVGDGLGQITGYTEETEAEETEETEETQKAETVTVTPTPEPTATETPTPSPTSTPTPTPSPTPLIERVDFSELTEVSVTADFKVEYEEFGETYLTEDGDELAGFSGIRGVVSNKDNEAVQNAINLITDGVYQEACGVYSRVCSEAEAEYELTGLLPEEPYSVSVDYSDSDNGRLYTVIMTYEYTAPDDQAGRYVYSATFDMLTGQYINVNTIAIDPSALTQAFKDKLASDVNSLPDAEEKDEIKADDIENIFIAAQQSGSGIATAVLYGEADGELLHTTIDMNDYGAFLNRYGALVFQID